MIVVKLDFHFAKKTSAYTYWRYVDENNSVIDLEVAIYRGYIKMLHETHNPNKTHWFEYYLVPESSKLVRIRKSNRGNTTTEVYYATEIKAPKEDIEKLEALGKEV